MTDAPVAQLDRGSTQLHDALSRASSLWDDSRREATARRYLLPHGEAHDRLQAQLVALLDASVEARAAARNADLAVTAAQHEDNQAHLQVAGAAGTVTEVQAATEAALRAEGDAAGVYANALALAEEANATAP
ncbi:MAG: hypothetical protein J2P57_14240 [Acidimicrobiaceae bacterium]|nr:hypothetical protein [Acidimicrobiaceae bacterium]